MANKTGPINLKNANLLEMNEDFLYHLAINVKDTKNTADIQAKFGDVKIICMGGTKERMFALAKYLNALQGGNNQEEPKDLCEAGHRYAVYKIGKVLCCSHGVGSSTMSVVLHELIKLVYYAKCETPIFIRVGTCGGLGVPPGTVVVTDKAFNGYLKNEHEIPILGKKVIRDASFDPEVLKGIVNCGDKNDGFLTIKGNTMSTDCFYEGQGRLDGASCDYTNEQKMEFLKKCQALGIVNIEMEATMFSSLTKQVGVRAADVCVTLIDRLQGDQVLTKKIENKAVSKVDPEKNLLTIVERYVRQVLNK